MPKRYVLTGAPGAGKTTLLNALAQRGHLVVPEAATDVIADAQASGVDAPWEGDDFLHRILALQQQRQLAPVPDAADVQLFDRSPLCTVALARYLNRPVPPSLAVEVARVLHEQVYEPEVFLVRPLGFITPTAARRISYPQALVFEAIHEAVYREHGFNLLDVPHRPVPHRIALIEHTIGLRRR